MPASDKTDSSAPPDGIPTPLGSFFPRQSMRAGQHDFYLDAKKACKDGKILFADAPTGIGKTAASISALLEEALPSGRKVIFLTNRNSHHLQAIIETLAINLNRKDVLSSIRPDAPAIKVIDKISKEKMCLRLFGKEGERPPFLLCEIARCPYQTPKQEHAQLLLYKPMTAADATALGAAGEAFCAHQTAVLAAADADLIICDYSYLFSPQISEIILAKMRLDLSKCDVIVDEAHNLPKRVRDINERKIDEETVKASIRGLNEIRKLAAENEDAEMGSKASFIARHLRTVVSPGIASMVYGSSDSEDEVAVSASALKFFRQKGSRLLGSGESEIDSIEDLIDEACMFFSEFVSKSKRESIDYEGIIALKTLSAFIRPADDFAWGSKKWGVFLKRGPARSGLFVMRATLFDPAEISSSVFKTLHSCTLMSGTLAGKTALRELLGVEQKRCLGLDSPPYISPFDPERQPIRVCTTASSRFADRNDSDKIEHMASIIETAAKACFPNSLAIYYPSYEFMQQVSSHLALDDYLVEKEGKKEGSNALTDRKNRIDNHSKSPKPIAFQAVIGAKYNEGVDFKNNPFKLIIVAGFPYPRTTPSHQAYESHLSDKFKDKIKANQYSSLYPAAISTMQTIGRGIRQSTDWCYCLLIDDRFASNSKFFSPEMVKRMKIIKTPDVSAGISIFMEKMKMD